MTCTPEDKIARLVATSDVLLGRDNSAALAEAYGIGAQVEYASRHAELTGYATPKLAKPRGTWVDMLFGNVADFAHYPNEVLGDDVAVPVLEAYERYARVVAGENATKHSLDNHEQKIDPERLREIKEDVGLMEATEDARDIILDKFEADQARLDYGLSWLTNRIEATVNNGQWYNFIRKSGSNLSRNLLLNNLRAATQNFVQIGTTTMPHFGIRATMEGRAAYDAAVKAKSPELEFIGGGRFHDTSSPLDKFDMFSMPEHANQGITYFTAKLAAKKAGKSDTAARRAGREAIERTQFKARLGNEPRGYWDPLSRTHLSLMSYGIQMKRLHMSWILGLGEGFATQNREMIVKNGKALAYFALANAAIAGPTADIPDEVAFFLKIAFPRFYANIRQADRWSLLGLLDMDAAELSRIPLTNVGWIAKVAVMYDKLEDLNKQVDKVLKHPGSPKNWIKAMQSGSMFAPAIPIIGNKNAGNLAEFAYRATVGDYTRYTFGGKKYKSDAGKEFMRVIKGRGYGEAMEANERDTRRARF